MVESVEIRHLVGMLNVYRDAYYNHNRSIITDKEYDELFDRLKSLEDQYGLVYSDSPTQSVGYSVVSKLNKVVHNHKLLSLDKTTDISEFSDYFKNYGAVIMAKLDGLTCSLLYRNGKLVQAESRGDGEVGEDITHNARVFSNLPLTIPYDGEVVIDGECIITHGEFEEIKRRENTEYKNPRNLVSGSVRQLNSEIAAKRNIRFIAWKLFSVIDKDGNEEKLTSHYENMKRLSQWGFEVVPHIFKNDSENMDLTVSDIQEVCNDIQYPIDGIVGMFDDIEYGNSLGCTGHHPRHSLAYKFYQEDNTTTLIDIEWNTSRSGLVNPVAVFEPVEIDGTTVCRATLNNVSIIKELELGIGDTISVIKANQIIPKVTQNLTRSNTYKIPTVCPECGEPLIIRNDNGREMLHCTNKNCKSIIVDKLANFGTRDAMNIVGISEARLNQFYDLGLLSSYRSIYELKNHREMLINQKGLGESSIDALLQAIEESKNCRLQNVIVAISIPGIGKSVAKMIEEICADEKPFEKFISLSLGGYDWTRMPGVGATMSNAINDFVRENKDELNALASYLNVVVENKNTTSKLGGKTFCITGKLVTFRNRDDLVTDIESNGGIVVSGVTAKTNYLITNDKASGSSKNKAAEKFGTTIISEDEYIQMR